jgi:hypothetical protein
VFDERRTAPARRPRQLIPQVRRKRAPSVDPGDNAVGVDDDGCFAES